MRMLRNSLLVLLVSITGLFVPCIGNGQVPITHFKIATPCPSFTLENVEQYRWPSFSPAREKGNWLLLHFFSMGCVSSFNSLRKLDSLHRLREVPLTVVLIGRMDKVGPGNPDIREEYRQFQEKYRLSMPVGYSASLFNELGIQSAPYSVLVDPTGVVRATFYVNLISQEALIGFIEGRLSVLTGDDPREHASQQHEPFDFRKPLLLNGNGGPADAFLFRSILTPALPQGAPNPVAIQRGFGNSIQFINAPIRDLLYVAFGDTVSKYPKIQPTSYGKYYPAPVWEFALSAADSQQFLHNLYCYSLQVPVPRPHPFWMQQIMQADLQQFFGIRVQVEEREMPCYVLRLLVPKAKLISKGGPSKDGQQAMGRVELQNVPMRALVQSLWGRYQQDTVFIDETGIHEPIDITYSTLVTDPLPEAIASLKQQGISVELTTRRMKVFVVRKDALASGGK